MKISAQDLVRFDACKPQRRVFVRVFDEALDGIEVTVANVLTAQAAGLDLGWLAMKIFTPAAWLEYRRIDGVCSKNRHTLDDLAFEKFERESPHNMLWQIHAKSQAWLNFLRAREEAQAAYERSMAQAWVAAFEASAAENRKGDE